MQKLKAKNFAWSSKAMIFSMLGFLTLDIIFFHEHFFSFHIRKRWNILKTEIMFFKVDMEILPPINKVQNHARYNFVIMELFLNQS